jgi:hypothetical protein
MKQAELLDLDTLDPAAARQAVEKSFYSIRSSQVRAIFSELVKPYFQTQSGRKRQSFFIGIQLLDRLTLERARLFGERLHIRGAMLLIIERNVPPALIEETIESLSMWGIFVSSEPVWQVIKDRCRFGLWIG